MKDLKLVSFILSTVFKQTIEAMGPAYANENCFGEKDLGSWWATR